MTKKNIIIGLSAIAAGLELGRTIQNIRINRLKRKLDIQRAEKFEEDLRHMKAMADIHEKYTSEAEKQHKIFESDMERLRNKIDELEKQLAEAE